MAAIMQGILIGMAFLGTFVVGIAIIDVILGLFDEK